MARGAPASTAVQETRTMSKIAKLLDDLSLEARVWVIAMAERQNQEEIAVMEAAAAEEEARREAEEEAAHRAGENGSGPIRDPFEEPVLG